MIPSDVGPQRPRRLEKEQEGESHGRTEVGETDRHNKVKPWLANQGTFLKRSGDWLNDAGYRRDFNKRYFHLEDGTLRYWQDESDMRKNPDSPSGVINAMDSEITVVQVQQNQQSTRI